MRAKFDKNLESQGQDQNLGAMSFKCGQPLGFTVLSMNQSVILIGGGLPVCIDLEFIKIKFSV